MSNWTSLLRQDCGPSFDMCCTQRGPGGLSRPRRVKTPSQEGSVAATASARPLVGSKRLTPGTRLVQTGNQEDKKFRYKEYLTSVLKVKYKTCGICRLYIYDGASVLAWKLCKSIIDAHSGSCLERLEKRAETLPLKEIYERDVACIAQRDLLFPMQVPD